MMMEKLKATSGGYFVLLGFSNWPRVEVVLFVVVLMFYLMTLTDNLFVIILSYLDSHLHTPMYFFLSNLSFLDLYQLHPPVAGQPLGPRKSHVLCRLHDSTLLFPGTGIHRMCATGGDVL